jgi:flavin reductase (DIM6/NTAB) family NADH-FMN oxidoreductase RutF
VHRLAHRVPKLRATCVARGLLRFARMKRASRRKLPLGQVYRLLEPGPVVLLTTARRGVPNVMTMSWHTMMDFEPPLVGCVVSDRNHSFAALRATGEGVIAVPTVEQAKIVVACGNTSGRAIDKLAAFGIATAPASQVGPPLVVDCYANLECRVIDTRMVRRYDLFVLEVVAAWIDAARAGEPPRTIHHRGRGDFMLAGRTVHLPSRAK